MLTPTAGNANLPSVSRACNLIIPVVVSSVEPINVLASSGLSAWIVATTSHPSSITISGL